MPIKQSHDDESKIIHGVCTIRYVKKFNRYELDAGLKLGGTRRHRKQFKRKVDALNYAKELQERLDEQGFCGFTLSREQQVDAENALKLLDGRCSLLQACKFFARYAGEHASNLSVSRLVSEFLDYKERQRLLGAKGASERTINDYRHRLGLVADQFKEVPLAEFREREFEDWILERGDVRGLTRTTKALFSYAVQNKYIPENPIKKRTPAPKIGKPAILSVKDCQSLVSTALASQDHRNTDRGERIDLLACVVLGLWCGLRPEAELKRLDWSDVNIEDGFVNIHDDWKVKIGRHVTIPECAKSLLRKCRLKEGPIVPQMNFRRRWDWLRKKAGVYESWESDIMRHTFASMHYAYYRDKKQVENELGHCNSSMLRHYINHGVKMRKQAKAFFEYKII